MSFREAFTSPSYPQPANFAAQSLCRGWRVGLVLFCLIATSASVAQAHEEVSFSFAQNMKDCGSTIGSKPFIEASLNSETSTADMWGADYASPALVATNQQTLCEEFAHFIVRGVFHQRVIIASNIAIAPLAQENQARCEHQHNMYALFGSRPGSDKWEFIEASGASARWTASAPAGQQCGGVTTAVDHPGSLLHAAGFLFGKDIHVVGNSPFDRIVVMDQGPSHFAVGCGTFACMHQVKMVNSVAAPSAHVNYSIFANGKWSPFVQDLATANAGTGNIEMVKMTTNESTGHGICYDVRIPGAKWKTACDGAAAGVQGKLIDGLRVYPKVWAADKAFTFNAWIRAANGSGAWATMSNDEVGKLGQRLAAIKVQLDLYNPVELIVQSLCGSPDGCAATSSVPYVDCLSAVNDIDPYCGEVEFDSVCESEFYSICGP